MYTVGLLGAVGQACCVYDFQSFALPCILLHLSILRAFYSLPMHSGPPLSMHSGPLTALPPAGLGRLGPTGVWAMPTRVWETIARPNTTQRDTCSWPHNWETRRAWPQPDRT